MGTCAGSVGILEWRADRTLAGREHPIANVENVKVTQRNMSTFDSFICINYAKDTLHKNFNRHCATSTYDKTRFINIIYIKKTNSLMVQLKFTGIFFKEQELK